MRRVLQPGLTVVGWSITLGLAAILTARVLAFDDNRVLLIANSLTYWIFLPVYLVLAAAIGSRRYRLAGCAALIVIAHVALVWPSLRAPTTIPSAARRAPHLRVLSANVLFDNPRPQEILGEIRDNDPDVIVLQEFSQHWQDALRASPVWDRYPYRDFSRSQDIAGLAILSRIPFTPIPLGNTHQALLGVRMDFADTTLTIFDVHPFAPVFNYGVWKDQSTAVSRELARARGPIVAAGDFNVTQFNDWLSSLQDLGLRSSHEELGRGTATTWPNGHFVIPPIRLDHVLVSKGITPLKIREGQGDGSDHRPVIVDLAITPR